jgi:hypothetical protein
MDIPILPIGAGMTIALEVSKRYVVRWGLLSTSTHHQVIYTTAEQSPKENFRN